MMHPQRRSAPELVEALREARQRSLDLISDLTPEQLLGPRLAIVNPMRWEIGHVAWFQGYWVLRHFLGGEPIIENEDALFNSATVPHDSRWYLPLPSRDQALEYADRVLDLVAERQDELAGLPARDGYDGPYFMELALLHESMQAEAF